MTKKVFGLSILLFLLPMIGFADAGALFKSNCIDCHGGDGMGNKEKQAPRIAGQHDWYILDSLRAFKSGERKNPEMLPYIKNLSDKDFQALAAYLSKL